MKTILLVAGDPSGDMHGADLIRALKRAGPSLKIAAVGGALMRAQANEFLQDLASHGIAGFWEPLRRLPMLWNLRRRLREFFARRKPDAVVCIDFYGFNRWVLEAAHQEGIPAYYYVSPQVWASRPGRIQIIRRLVKRMLVIFPFEEKLYRDAGVPVTFVGHPLLDRIPEPTRRNSAVRRVGLLPGSRAAEVNRHLPIFLRALKLLREDKSSLKACVFAAPSLPDSDYAEALRHGVNLVREDDYALRSKLDLAFTSSGTATLENALLGIPMIVVYRMSLPTYWIARSLIRVPHIAMANLLAGRALVPELIQGQATPRNIAEAALRWLENPPEMERVSRSLLSLRNMLGTPGATDRAAGIILQELGAADTSVESNPSTTHQMQNARTETSSHDHLSFVTPAQAGVHHKDCLAWIPAFAGMTRWGSFEPVDPLLRPSFGCSTRGIKS